VISTPHDANTQVLMLSVSSLAFLGDFCGECNDEVGEQRNVFQNSKISWTDMAIYVKIDSSLLKYYLAFLLLSFSQAPSPPLGFAPLPRTMFTKSANSISYLTCHVGDRIIRTLGPIKSPTRGSDPASRMRVLQRSFTI